MTNQVSVYGRGGTNEEKNGRSEEKEREEGMSARYLLVCAVYLVKINIIVHFKDIKVDFESLDF